MAVSKMVDAVPTLQYKALTFSAADEESLQKSVFDALSGNVDIEMGVKRCAAFPAVNDDHFLCELMTKETKSIIGKFADKVRGRLFVEHTTIHLMYIPVIIDTTHAVAELKLKYMATGDTLYEGTKVNLNEAFVLTMTWPRSMFADDVNKHKGLYLGGTVFAPTTPKGSKIGMWYPLWTERVSSKQLYQRKTDINNTKVLETFTKKLISSDADMRRIMRTRISVSNAAKKNESLISCANNIDLVDQHTSGIDFTMKSLPAGGKSRIESKDVKNTTLLEQMVVPKEHDTTSKLERGSTTKSLMQP